MQPSYISITRLIIPHHASSRLMSVLAARRRSIFLGLNPWRACYWVVWVDDCTTGRSASFVLISQYKTKPIIKKILKQKITSVQTLASQWWRNNCCKNNVVNNWVCCFQTTTIKTYPETNQSNQNRSWQQVEYKLTNTLYAPPDRSAPHPFNVKIINFPHRNERIRSVAHQYFFGECNKTATIKQGDRKIHFHSVAFETPSKRRRRRFVVPRSRASRLTSSGVRVCCD